MVTINQVLKKCRKKKRHKSKSPRLNKKPQLKTVCLKIVSRKPKKPNSALRKVAITLIPKTQKFLTVYVPGQGHNLQRFSTILIRGGRVKDLPGIHYKAIRGKYDFNYRESFFRKKGRSKYGVKKKLI